MRRIFSLLNQVAVTLEDNTGLQTQMDSAVRAAQKFQEDNQLLERVSPDQRRQHNFSLLTSCNHNAASCQLQALLDEEKAMTINNQQLKTEVEKLKKQVKAADEGEGFPITVTHHLNCYIQEAGRGEGGCVIPLNIKGAPAPTEQLWLAPGQKR